MSQTTWMVVAFLVTVVAAVPARRWLERRSYRREDERDARVLGLGWFIPAAVLVGTLVAAGVHARTGSVVASAVYLAAGMVLAVLAAIDLDVHRLPDAIQLPAYPMLVAGLGLASWTVGDWGALVRAIIGGGIGFALFLGLALIGSGMGFGDVKLAGLLGLLLGWLGWSSLLYGLAAGIVLGGVIGAALFVTRRASRTSDFAYGPPLILGAVAVIAAAPLGQMMAR